ncbi:MAG: hypothetical protein HY698_06555 [Deltaproteobacteria bacterium]|nr:hypothetical protein [Deltaproteobacteria bacterium]
MKRVAVVILARDPARVEEALRAAVGLTLRGARVDVILRDGDVPRDERTLRSRATLIALGHRVGASLSAMRECDAVEVWT